MAEQEESSPPQQERSGTSPADGAEDSKTTNEVQPSMTTEANAKPQNDQQQQQQHDEAVKGHGSEGEEDQEEELLIEQPLFTIKEVFVYRVPPLRASSGHRAEEWGLADPVFTGVLKMVQIGNSCCLRLFKPPPDGELGASPELFAECEVRLDNGRTFQVYVEPVIDSSRYFVLRCEDKASGRHAYVGIGFRERSTAFDLKAVLDDFVRFLDRQKKAAETSAVAERDRVEGDEKGGGEAPVRQMKDLSIAEGQKLHIDLKVPSSDGPTRTRRRPRSSGDNASSKTTGGGLGLLAPPPLPGTMYKASPATVSPPVAPVTTPTTGSPPTTMAADETLPNDDRKGMSESDEGGGKSVLGVSVGGKSAAVGAATKDDSGWVGKGEDEGWGDFESA